MDLAEQDFASKEFGTSWRFDWACPPKGTRLRATAWVLVRTTYPDPAVSLAINWLNSNHRWYTKKNYEGSVTVPVKVNEWQKVSLEAVVPDVDEIKFFSPIVGCHNLATGKMWIGELKLETVEK